MEETTYKNSLDELIRIAEEIPNTEMMAAAKISTLVVLNMRYEIIMLDRSLEQHPSRLVSNYIRDAITTLNSWKEVVFIEAENKIVASAKSEDMEQFHNQLFQELWINFSDIEYEQRIERYQKRLRINGIDNHWFNGLRCIDFGCGHGNFAHALIREGADYVLGIDFGERNIEYSLRARDQLEVPTHRLDFRVEDVYCVSEADDSFDFAIQNGVFHHLEDEDAAYGEVYRVLKPGGWFWIYTDGEGGISHDLWDASAYILRDIPALKILDLLDRINVETGKRYHLGDGLNAIYRHTTWEALIRRLEHVGFGNFRRLVGGFPTDFDHDVIAEDRWGKEKFGSGDIRLLAQKMT